MTSSDCSMTWSLSDPGMGILERAGLAALFMSLRAADERTHDLSPLRWNPQDLQRDSVTLRWSGTAEEALGKLVTWAWQVRDGVLFFPAVHRDARQREFPHLRVPMHNGILSTFLQHVRVQPRGELVKKVEQISEGEEILFRYQTLDPAVLREKARSGGSRKKKSDAEGAPVTDGDPRKSRRKAPCSDAETLRPIADLKKKFFSLDGHLSSVPVSLSSWVSPGIAPRFGDKGAEKAWQGPAKIGLLLLLAPVACLYQRLPSQRERLKGKGPRIGRKKQFKWTENWVFVVPDVRDLEEFDDVRPHLSLDPKFVDVGSLGDAAMRFASEYSARPVQRSLQVGCRVTAMGKVPFYEAQSVRKGVLDIGPSMTAVRRYMHLQRALGNRYVPLAKIEDSDDLREGDQDNAAELRPPGFVRLPSGRGRIADNLVAERPWYRDLFTPLTWDRTALETAREREQQRPDRRGNTPSVERLWFIALSYQGEPLMELIREEEMWESKEDRILVEAFWETLDSLYAQEARAASERGGSRSVEKRWEHLDEEIYRRLMRSKTRDLLRETLSELFAKAGRQSTIGKHHAEVWHLMNDSREWKRARDLSLLALATHRSKGTRTGSNPDALSTNQGR